MSANIVAFCFMKMKNDQSRLAAHGGSMPLDRSRSYLKLHLDTTAPRHASPAACARGAFDDDLGHLHCCMNEAWGRMQHFQEQLGQKYGIHEDHHLVTSLVNASQPW